MDENNIPKDTSSDIVDAVNTETSVVAPLPIASSVPQVSTPMPQSETVIDANVLLGDVWSNNDHSFRVDNVAPTGGVRIRFRSDATLDAQPFSIKKIQSFFQKKSSVPSGEWFFGSSEEFKHFVDDGGYQLEKRVKKEEDQSTQKS